MTGFIWIFRNAATIRQPYGFQSNSGHLTQREVCLMHATGILTKDRTEFGQQRGNRAAWHVLKEDIQRGAVLCLVRSLQAASHSESSCFTSAEEHHTTLEIWVLQL